MARKGADASRLTVTGDVIVTRVSDHYHVSRSQGPGKPFIPIEVVNDRADAIARACQLATGTHRVFLYAQSGTAGCIEIDCTKPD